MSEPADGKIRVAGSREVYQSILTEKAKKKGAKGFSDSLLND